MNDMRRYFGLFILLCLLSAMTRAEERTQLFNDAWRFHRGDVPEAMQSRYADEHWRMVELPHDWRLTPDSLNEIESSADTVGWYRKTFTIAPSDTARSVYVCFERIHGKADIWVNDTLLYRTTCSYEPIKIDVTHHLNAPLERNTLAIRVSATPKDSATYRGAGITHDTWLMKPYHTHLDDWSSFVKTNRVYSRRGRWHAELALGTLIRHAGVSSDGHQLHIRIVDPEGSCVYDEHYMAPSEDSTAFSTKVTLSKPRSWFAETPDMYRATFSIGATEEVCDSVVIPFGISTLFYSPDMGLVCNDESPLIQGSTLDYNARLTGYTAFRRAEALLVEHLQCHGYTAVRCPMGLLSEHFLTACDTLGVMVLADVFAPIDSTESWSAAATVDNIRRFRNHPSIVMWCIDDSLSQYAIVCDADDSRPIAVTDMLHEHLWSDERTAVGDHTPYAYQLDAERLVSSLVVGVSAPDTLQTDSTVWLPEQQRWTWHGYEGQTMKLNVYSRNDWVAVYLNDRLVGNAKTNKHTHRVSFYVSYAPGKLDAVTDMDMRKLWRPKKARSKIKLSGRFRDHFRLFTEGEPTYLYLSADRTITSNANGELCFVKIEVLDADGNLLPDAEIPLSLHVRGPGIILAAGNGREMSSSLTELQTYQGSALVVIRPFDEVGTIRLTVRSEGLDTEDIAIKVTE